MPHSKQLFTGLFLISFANALYWLKILHTSSVFSLCNRDLLLSLCSRTWDDLGPGRLQLRAAGGIRGFAVVPAHVYLGISACFCKAVYAWRKAERMLRNCEVSSSAWLWFFLAVMIKVTDSPRGVQCLCETDPLKFVDSFVMRIASAGHSWSLQANCIALFLFLFWVTGRKKYTTKQTENHHPKSSTWKCRPLISF